MCVHLPAAFPSVHAYSRVPKSATDPPIDAKCLCLYKSRHCLRLRNGHWISETRLADADILYAHAHTHRGWRSCSLSFSLLSLLSLPRIGRRKYWQMPPPPGEKKVLSTTRGNIESVVPTSTGSLMLQEFSHQEEEDVFLPPKCGRGKREEEKDMASLEREKKQPRKPTTTPAAAASASA